MGIGEGFFDGEATPLLVFAPDLDDVPRAVRDALDVHLVSDAHEAQALAVELASVNALAA